MVSVVKLQDQEGTMSDNGEKYLDIIRFSKDRETLHNHESIKIPGDKLIIVDIQPIYNKGMPFTIEQFAKSLKNFKGEVLYFYNGVGMGLDKGLDIVYWYMASLNDYSDKLRNRLRDVTWIEKGYGFFRDSIDDGFSHEEVKTVFNFLTKNQYWASDEASDEEIDKLEITGKLKELLKNEKHVISVPNFDFEILKKYNGATIVGGGENQCLLEIIILMDAMGLSYKKFEEFIY